MTEKKKFNYRHIICIAATIGCAACVFAFPSALIRVIEGGRDFGKSVAYYFCEMFGIEHNIVPTVNNLPQSPSHGFPALPDSFDGFKSKWTAYWRLWASGENVIAYFAAIGNIVSILCKIVVIALPIVFALWFAFKRYLKHENNDYNRDSKPLRIYKKFVSSVCSPIQNFLVSLFDFIRAHKGYYISWLCMWLLYFNAYTIVLEFLAFYLYFIVSFDISAVYRQVYKLFSDLWAAIDFIPIWVWSILGIWLFDRFRKKIAYARLHHMEMRNRGFVNARPVVFMINGTMGTGKTTSSVDMGLSQTVMFRDKAFEKLLENDLKFPYFPWINLENELRRAMENHDVYNLATCKEFVRLLRHWNAQCYNLSETDIKAVRRHLRRRYGVRVTNMSLQCFDYDKKRYGTKYHDHLQITDLWQVLEIYSQLYFVYVIESSLLLANFSVRVDDLLSDLGNFPMWNSDFFHRDSRLIDSYSRHAHILDFDSLRLGKRVIANNRNADGFEFGVILITEVGKERGNNLENKGKKTVTAETNQNNDGFNKWLKMIRHSATIDNYPFVKVITDEQRPESWGADARDLCELVYIREKSDTRLAMPFFSLGELLFGWLYPKFAGLYSQYRYVRSDNTLPMYLLKAITAKMHGYYSGIYNRFGYNVLKVQVESGTQDGERSENKYFIMHKKIYSKRFSTDCFADFFTQKALRSPTGINDLPEYAAEKATFEELRMQNSYFIHDLTNSMRGKHNEKEK
ncbi:hypothetical protein [Pumilibacter intestinalis]|uniref:hypothetical protein n=1 Tax=Pumilibacter intestinalis TaxID=2941511 RepID=UPI00203AE1F9|nr:hypothetical protein [Pumilibacter intestinalis]